MAVVCPAAQEEEDLMSHVAVLLVGVILTAVFLWCYFTAQRLHRLHIRTDRARDSLEGALNRRAAVIAALFPELVSQASNLEDIELSYENFDARRRAETELIRAVLECGTKSGLLSEPFLGLDDALPGSDEAPAVTSRENSDPGTQVSGHRQHVVALSDANVRVHLATRFYNQAVADTRHLRHRPLVKLFRLAGNAPIPAYF